MTRPAGATLVVVDFSGTLSLDMVRFAAPDRIGAELRRSGLAALGIDSPELFWDRLVAPTWDQASTTTRGYAEVLTAEVCRVLRVSGRDARADAVGRSVRAFVDRYLAWSTIAPQWRGCLRRLARHAGAAPVVATDHYAEVTAQIVAELARLGVPGAPVGSSSAGIAAGTVAVANSADLGCHKSSARYWHAVGHALRPSEISRVVLVDDFGANEAPGDVYADTTRVQHRRADTIAGLASVFGVAPHVYPFVLPGPAATDDDVAALVDGAERFTMNVLSSPS